ncbi:MAG: hypothetical protein A3G22_02655 [Alphaproteobacteria bacterium RIFCSPLOWO2_12_FULL_40_11]|nr:MAG: hypothetical protein A3G22_02655 [Alphaproteobacteria bacterium RIFCSPLOWO2_12_FULL_40_11]
MKFSRKDKSLLLLIATALIVLWLIFLLISNLLFPALFPFADIRKITDIKADWLNVSHPLENRDLKSRVILLHFWNHGCVSCLVTLPAIKKLEKELGNKLLVIGIHSSTLANSKDAVKKAMLKYDISHPVINDPDLKIWNDFAVKAWPTFILINPHGNVEEIYVGEKSVKNLADDTKNLVAKYKYEINRDPLPLMLEKYNVIGNVLSFPTRVAYTNNLKSNFKSGAAIFIANSGQNNIVIAALNGDIIMKIGSGREGNEDGDFESASFTHPHGLLFDGLDKLYIADSGNNSLRVVDFNKGKVETLLSDLSFPNDLEFFPDKNNIVISNSAAGQILSYDLKSKKTSILASGLPQTSDMSVFASKLYFVDAMDSSLRVLDKKNEVKILHKGVKLPLALHADDTGIYIADASNNQIKKYDYSSSKIHNFSKVELDAAEGIIAVLDRFYIADSNNNRIMVLNRRNLENEILNVMPPLKLPKVGFLEYLPNLQKISEAKVQENAEIMLKIDLADGWKINEQGPSFINLLELVKESEANLIASFDWNSIKVKEMKLPKFVKEKNYLLKGTIYYCEDQPNALCYIKSYEQKIVADDGREAEEIVIKLGY